ncbi:MAG TPA: DUF4920 domain-containing protein [Rheinheimera sp.]|uniref:DUF4920 domain-containing protein n=1 Tax=Rheinheimera sp. TaxID=1869214 RepID=UPI002F955578
MLKTFYALLATSLLLSAQAATLFGETVDKTVVIPVSQLLQPANYLDKEVTISGTVDSVCSKQGCWMRFSTEDASLPFRIKVRDGDMVFPLSAKGKTAYATGTVRLWPQGEEEPDAYQLYPTAVEIAE